MTHLTGNMAVNYMNVNTAVYIPSELYRRVLEVDNRFAILEPMYADLIAADIESNIRSSDCILSFDVFDTLLLRNHRAELTRFFEVSGLVADYISVVVQRTVSQYDVLFGRLLANRISYRLSPALEGCREGTITDIYRTILAQLNVPTTDSLIDACVEIELSYEATQLTVNQPLFDLIYRHLQRGGRAIYISDMYLKATHINTLFTRLGVDHRLFTATYSSADTIISKRSGKIWPWVCDQLSVTSRDVLHIGDSLVSDYQKPKHHGIAAVHIPIPWQMRRDIMADYGAMVDQLESLQLPIQSWMAPPHW